MASTQQKHPWRATVRTIFAYIVGIAAAWALIIEAAGIDAGIEWVATSLAVAAGITRVMALPAIDRLLPSWLTSDGTPSGRDISK